MKYAVFTKKIGELDVSDFDEEVLNQYENLTLRKEGLSYTVDGQEVITTTDNLIQDMCERQIEFIFNDFAERVAKKMHEVVEKEPIIRCEECKHHGTSNCQMWGNDTTEDYMWCCDGERKERDE